jgi:hypothetical protein
MKEMEGIEANRGRRRRTSGKNGESGKSLFYVFTCGPQDGRLLTPQERNRGEGGRALKWRRHRPYVY